MYEMITGHVPFDGDSTVTVALKHLNEVIKSPAEEVPDIPYSLECIIMKCTQKLPNKRYMSCEELLQDLKHSLVDPDGDFVVLDGVTKRMPAASQDTGRTTVVMSPDELNRMKNRQNYNDDMMMTMIMMTQKPSMMMITTTAAKTVMMIAVRKMKE